MPSIWERLKSWFAQDGAHSIAHAVPRAQADVAYDDTPIAGERGYVRIWLVDMFLTQARSWFQDWQPAVHGRIKLSFANQTKEFVRLAAPSSDKFRANRAVLSNYVLLDLVPFRGGLIEIETGLLAMRGEDRLARAISVVSGFADLVAPPLGRTLDVASKIKEGINTLFTEGDEIHLAAHQTLGGSGGANPLRPGYLAIIRATERELDPTPLTVRGDKLCTADGAPLTGFDYMLLRIEAAATRDDLQQFSDIAELRSVAIEAYLGGDATKGDALLTAAMVRIASHPELINADRRALAKALREELADYKDPPHGAVPRGAPTWADLVNSLRPVADHAPVTLRELLDT